MQTQSKLVDAHFKKNYVFKGTEKITTYFYRNLFVNECKYFTNYKNTKTKSHCTHLLYDVNDVIDFISMQWLDYKLWKKYKAEKHQEQQENKAESNVGLQ